MNQKNDVFDSANVFVFIIKWWKHLFVICFLAAVAAAIFSGPRFITPMFQSTVTMFPASTNSLSRSVLSSSGGSQQDFLQYGEVEEAERLLQVLESANIRDRVVQRFNLLEHYEIPEDSQYKQTNLALEYNSNISFRRTQYGAVEIKVRDKDPVMAADIANELAALVDTVQNELRHERAELAYQVARTQYETLLVQARQAEDSLRYIMSRGFFHLEGQSSMLTRQLAMDISAQNVQGIESLEGRLSSLGEFGGAFLYNQAYLQNITEHLIMVQRRYLEAKSDLENFLPFKFIIDTAFEAERKVYPVRWVIVFLSTFAAGFIGIMIIMVYENLQVKGIIKK
jgi:capsular polysaccharide biosynthesis protein